MAEKLVIYGAGYPDIVKLVEAINRHQLRWEIVGFIDDTPEKQHSTFMGYPVLGDRRFLDGAGAGAFRYFNNVYSDTWSRKEVGELMARKGVSFATLVHPDVDVSHVQLGCGTIVGQGVALGANVRIGDHCAVRYNAVISHDSTLENYVFIGPGATLCGHVTVRGQVFVGAGSVVRERTEIGVGATVGAGAAVVDDVPPRITVAGVPARALPIKKTDPQAVGGLQVGGLRLADGDYMDKTG